MRAEGSLDRAEVYIPHPRLSRLASSGNLVMEVGYVYLY